MDRKTNVIGIGGVATTGKDLAASILSAKLADRGLTVQRVALASPLKGDLDEFCEKNFGFSSYTQVPEEKQLIRPALVWYGDAQRKRTGGRHWIDQAQATIDKSAADVIIVTDVRYDHYEKDEVYWITRELNGLLVHVSQFTWATPLTTKVSNPTRERVFVAPANDHEMLNDPKVKAKAQCVVEWENVGKLTQSELLVHPKLNEHMEFVRSTFMADWFED